MVDDFNDHVEAKSSVMEQVEEVQANLAARFPGFVKTMVRSNVNHGFWLHLPFQFCKLHMPRHATLVSLEDESGEEYRTNYIAERTALSGGWKAFSAAHKLLEGDVLSFYLVKSCKFKVYIVRASGSSKVDGGHGFQNLDTRAKPIDSVHQEKNIKTCKKAKHMELLPVQLLQDNFQKNSRIVSDMNYRNIADQFEDDSEHVVSNKLEGITSSGSIVDFKEVKSIDNFTILVNGLTIDSELSDHHRAKYYELCCTQNSFLHDHLLKSINSKLAAQIITETINIAEAIRSCKFSTIQADYAVWDQTLKGFEVLGMNVGVLQARLNQLMKLAMELEEAEEIKTYKKVSLERALAEKEMKTLELKLLDLKESMGRLDAEMEALKQNADRHELMFQEEVNAPW